jgi:hypothetical protein
MKKVILLCGTLLALSATIASAAAGVNLRWNNCFGDAGVANRNFACTSNTGSNVIFGSFELGQDMLTCSGEESVLDLASASAVLPAWWAFKNVGTCRITALSVSFGNPSAINCPDWSSGQAAGGIGAYTIGERGPNTARIKVVSAVPLAGLTDLFTGQEYFAYSLAINNTKTVGTGACAGCLDPVCIVFNSIKITTPVGSNDRTWTGPTNGTDSNFATWQGGGGVVVGPNVGCPAATGTKNATWGAVKSLYR